MTLRTKTLTAALALAISAGGSALAQDAVTITPAPADQAVPGQTPAPAAPAEAGSGQTPTGETATAPTQSSEPTSPPAGAEQTPMEAPETPSVTATDGETPAEPQADAAAEQPAAPADATAEPAAEEPAAEAPAENAAEPVPAEAEAAPVEEPAAEEPAAEAPAEETTEAPEAEGGAGEQAVDAVGLTEDDEAAVPAETTGTVVAEEGHDDIEGAAEEDHAAAAADHGAPHIEDIAFSFEGPFGKYDQFQLQRGLQVYTEVCAACHGMKFVPIRTLHDDGGPGLPEDQVRAYAANLTPVLDTETGEERPRLPTDHFPLVTGDGMGPDLSLMAKARAGFHGPQGTGINQLMRGIGGPEYIHALLTSYTGEEIEQAGTVLYENTAFSGGYISMPSPLSDDLVTYEDGTPATVDQMARDVSAFLMWTAEPKLTDRKQVGLVAVLMLIVLTSLLYLTNKRIWAPHKGKKLHR